MAFYTGPAQLNLPRSPDQYFAMNAALPSIRPVDFLAWSSWRQNHRIHSTPTKPNRSYPSIQLEESDVDHYRSSSSILLPPITQLDPNLSPSTPPEVITSPSSRLALPKIETISSDAGFFEPKPETPAMSLGEDDTAHHLQTQPLLNSSSSSPSTLQIPSQPISSSLTSMDTSVPPPEVTPNTSAAAASIINTLALAPAPPSYMVDWLDFTLPSHAKVAGESARAGELTTQDTNSDSVLAKSKSTPSVTSLQLVATPAFVSFVQKLLETTQVSQSVIVLSLHYIHRLKESNAYTPAQPGSEFRIAVTSLMMANKFLDDNTYTNKTWSEVSGISQDEINRMEREFLFGVDFDLYVDKSTYASWLNLLKGLVHAKERDARRLLRGGGMRVPSSARRGMKGEREGRFWHPHHPHHPNGAHSRFGNSSKMNTGAAPSNAVHGNGPAVDLFSTRRRSAHPPLDQEPAYPRRHRARSTSPRSFNFSSSLNRSAAVSHVQEQPYTLNVSSEVPPQEQSAYSHQYYQTMQPASPLAVPSMDYAYPSSSPPISNDVSAPELTTVSTGMKRSAADAFESSPPSAFISRQTRLRRPSSMYGRLHTLQIPEFSSTSSATSSSVASSIARHTTASNPSPLEGLGGFERMSLDGEERAREKERREAAVEERRAKKAKAEPPVVTVIPQTLMAAYSAEEARRVVLPKNLFFYTLASSPSTDEREQLRSERGQSVSSDSMGIDAESESYVEPRARKARLRCQAAQPAKYGYNYADLNGFPATRYAPLYSYHEPSSQSSTQSQQAYVSTSGTSNVTMSPTPTAYAQSHRQPHEMPSQPAPIPFPSQGQLSQAAVIPSASASPVSYGGSAGATSLPLPRFRDDVWARTPLPAQSLQQQNQVPSQSPACLGQVTGAQWIEQGRQKEEQVIDYSDLPAVQTSSSAAASSMHISSPYRHRYPSTNGSSSSHPGSAASSPYYHQENIRRQMLQDVPCAPFANAGPPGVGVQFYATPEVQQMPPVYNPGSYAAYSSPAASNAPSIANGRFLIHPNSGPSNSVPQGWSTYTYSGAHSTSNSPYHSAASGMYRYSNGYSGQTPSSSGYGRY